MTRRKRIPEIDIAKAFGISIVILQHAGLPLNNTFTFLTVFALPLFFLLSGAFLHREEDLGAFAGTRTKRLLLPYLYFSIIDMAVLFAIDLIKTKSVHPGILLTDLFRFVTMYGISVLWFLSALWMSELLFVLSLNRKKKLRIVLSVLLILLLAATSFLRAPLFAFFERTSVPVLQMLSLMLLRLPVCIFFLALGHTARLVLRRLLTSGNTGIRALRDFWHRLPAFLKGLLLLVASSLCLTATYAAAVANDGGNIPLIYYGKNLGLYLFAASIGSLGVLLLSAALLRLFPASSPLLKALCFTGANSLIIMLTHMDLHLITLARIAVGLLSMLLSALFAPGAQIFFWIFLLFFTLLIEVPVILLIRRFFPFLLGLPGIRPEKVTPPPVACLPPYSKEADKEEQP